MADDLTTLRAASGPAPCPHCLMREKAIPMEAQLRILATEDWAPELVDFIPKAMTQEQAVAAEMLVAGLARYAKAFGVDLAGARLTAMLASLREQAKRSRIMGRQLEARAEINGRARDCYDRGDHDAAHAIEAEATPDYPGKARDDAWLRGGLHA